MDRSSGMDSTPLARLCAYRGANAAELDLHPADRFAVAGGELPGRYRPGATGADKLLVEIRHEAWGRSRAEFDELCRFARGLADPGRPAPDPLPPLEPVTVGGVVQRLMLVRNMPYQWLALDAGLAVSTVRRVMYEGIRGNPAAVVSALVLGEIGDALGLRRGDFLAIAGRADEVTPEMRADDERPVDGRHVRLLRDLAPLPLEALQRFRAHLSRRPRLR
jgi:hypothetical protein